VTGAGIRAIRDRLGLTQSALAALVGVERECVVRWEGAGAKRIRLRSRHAEVLIVVSDFPTDGEEKHELSRHLRAKRYLHALAFILARGRGTTVAVL
jgi:transcriptional regulator with XRE-family HTH domain